MRRLRGHPVIRDLVREHEIFLNDLVVPLFVVEGLSQPQEISSMPGQFRYPIPELVEHCKQLYALGLKAIILFGVPMNKDPEGSQAYAEDGIIQAAVRAIRASVPQLLIMTDVCLCEYTSHGHCGLIKNGQVANDETLELLAKTALSHVLAGAQVIAPSDMMDGRILAIRKILDQHAHTDIPIISYAAKYASAYYGPFREAAQSTPQFGDRRSYQMDPANLREALREVAIDIEESADIVMVKPALAYLDVIRAVRQTFQVPVAAYNVSGEYAMIKAAAQNSWIDERRIVIETLTSMKRAGADLIFSYHAPDVARWLNES
jgi:porphobilinogen synthase